MPWPGPQMPETELGRRYAGDTIRVTVLRGKQRIERDVKLAAKLEPFQPGFLGILPMRSADEQGVTVRYVYPKSPAAAAGIAAGDVLVSLGGEPIEGRQGLIAKSGVLESGAEVELEVQRADAVRKLKATLTTLPEDLPPDVLPPANASLANVSTARETDTSGRCWPAEGWRRAAETRRISNEVWAYVPEKYAAGVSYGVVVWLHAPGGYVDWKELLARWKPLCDRHDLILVAPKSSDPARWASADSALVVDVVEGNRFHVSRGPGAHRHPRLQRGRIAGLSDGVSISGVIRGVATVEAAPASGPPPENEPLHRLAIYVGVADKSPALAAVERATDAMRRMKLPVTVKKLDGQPRYLNAAELAELARWIDTLDRI